MYRCATPWRSAEQKTEVDEKAGNNQKKVEGGCGAHVAADSRRRCEEARVLETKGKTAKAAGAERQHETKQQTALPKAAALRSAATEHSSERRGRAPTWPSRAVAAVPLSTGLQAIAVDRRAHRR